MAPLSYERKSPTTLTIMSVNKEKPVRSITIVLFSLNPAEKKANNQIDKIIRTMAAFDFVGILILLAFVMQKITAAKTTLIPNDTIVAIIQFIY